MVISLVIWMVILVSMNVIVRFLCLSVSWDGFGVNFVLFLVYVMCVELCLFDECGEIEIERIELLEYIDEIWYGYLFDVRLG